MAALDFGKFPIIPLSNVMTNTPTDGDLTGWDYMFRMFQARILNIDPFNDLKAVGSMDIVGRVDLPVSQRPYKPGDVFFFQVFEPAEQTYPSVNIFSLVRTTVSGVEHMQFVQIL